MVLSALIHIALISLIGIKHNEYKKSLQEKDMLRVVLVNAKTLKAPKDADVIAQSNLDRGGNVKENREAKTMFSGKDIQEEIQLSESVETKEKMVKDLSQSNQNVAAQQKKVEELENQVKEYLTRLKSTHKVPSSSAKNSSTEENKNNTANSPQDVDQEETLAMIIARKEAQIAKTQEMYEKRPKRQFIGARAKESRFAMYVESWRQRVEEVGTREFQVWNLDNKTYGTLRLSVSIKQDGTIEKIWVNQSSGKTNLDQAAIKIVMMSAPFDVFPAEISRDTEIITITKTWNFTNHDSLVFDEI